MEEGEIEDGEIIESDGGGGGGAAGNDDSMDRDVNMARSIMAQLDQLRNAEEGKGPTKKKKKKKKKKKPMEVAPELAQKQAVLAKLAAEAPPKVKKRANYVDHDRIEDDWAGSFPGLKQQGGGSGGGVGANFTALGVRVPRPPQQQSSQLLLRPPTVVQEKSGPKRSPTRSPSPPGLYDSPYESSDDQFDGQAGGKMLTNFSGEIGNMDHIPPGRKGANRPPRGPWKKNLRKAMKKRKPFEKGGPRGMNKLRKEQKPQKPRLICRFYLEGKCSKGKDCTYSHDVEIPKKMSLCKFYLNGFCAKSEICLFMHKDFPCKFFHTGAKCYADDNCKFSHEPLTEEGRKILDRYLTKEDRSSPDSCDSPGLRPSLLGSPPHGQPNHGQPPHGQHLHGQPNHGPPLPHGLLNNGQPHHGQQAPHGPLPHGQPFYGQQLPQGPHDQQMPQGPHDQQMPQGPHGQQLPHGPHGQQLPHGPHGQQLPHGPHGQQLPHGPHGQQLPHGPYGQQLPHGPHGQQLPHGPHGQQLPHGPHGQQLPHGPHGQQMPHGPHGQQSPHGPPPHNQQPPHGPPPHGQQPNHGPPHHGQQSPHGPLPHGQQPHQGPPPHGQHGEPHGQPPHLQLEFGPGQGKIPSLFEIDVRPPGMRFNQMQQPPGGPHMFYGERMPIPPNGPFGPFGGGMPHPGSHEGPGPGDMPQEDWEREMSAMTFGMMPPPQGVHMGGPPGAAPPGWMGGGGGGELDQSSGDDWQKEMVARQSMFGASRPEGGGQPPANQPSSLPLPPEHHVSMSMPPRMTVPEQVSARLPDVTLPLDIDERYLQLAKAAMYRLGDDLPILSSEGQSSQPDPPKLASENPPFHPVPWRHLAVEDTDLRSKLPQRTRAPSGDNAEDEEDLGGNRMFIDVKEEPTSGAERDRSSGSESDHRRSPPPPSQQQPPPASFAVPLHLPKKQRELFMRIQQQQQQRLLAENSSSQDEGERSESGRRSDDDDYDDSDADEKLQPPPIAIKEEPKDTPTTSGGGGGGLAALERVRQADEEADTEPDQEGEEKERWYSSDEDDDDEDRPMMAVLKKLQQQPVPVARADPPRPAPKSDDAPPPFFNITKMLQSIAGMGQSSRSPGSGSDSPAPADVKPIIHTDQPKPLTREPRSDQPKPVADPRLGPTSRDPRGSDHARSSRPDPRARDPRSMNRVPVNIPTTTTTVDTRFLPRDPRQRTAAAVPAIRDPRLSMASRTSIDSPPPATRDPRLIQVSSSTDVVATDLRPSTMKRERLPLLPAPRCDTTSSTTDGSAERPATDNTSPRYQHIPYRLHAVAISHPNYSSLIRVSQSDPKLLFTDPRLKRQIALGSAEKDDSAPGPVVVVKTEKPSSAVVIKSEVLSQPPKTVDQVVPTKQHTKVTTKTEKASAATRPPPLPLPPMELPPLPSLAALANTTPSSTTSTNGSALKVSVASSAEVVPGAGHTILPPPTTTTPRFGLHRLGAATMPARGESLVRRLPKVIASSATFSPASPRVITDSSSQLPSIAALISSSRRVSSPASPPSECQSPEPPSAVTPIVVAPVEEKGDVVTPSLTSASPATRKPKKAATAPSKTSQPRLRKATMDYSSPLGYGDTDDKSTASGYDRKPRAAIELVSDGSSTSSGKKRKAVASSSSSSSGGEGGGRNRSKRRHVGLVSGGAPMLTMDGEVVMDDETPLADSNTSLKEIFKTIDPTASPFC